MAAEIILAVILGMVDSLTQEFDIVAEDQPDSVPEQKEVKEEIKEEPKEEKKEEEKLTETKEE